VVFPLTYGLAAAKEVKDLPVDIEGYQACIKREAESEVNALAVRVTPLYNIDTKLVGDKAFAVCAHRYRHYKATESLDMLNAEFLAGATLLRLLQEEQQRKADEERRQAELDATKLKAESDAANQGYVDCLFGHARMLALSTTEPADTVAEATFASCQKERQYISQVHQKYKDNTWSDDVLDIADTQFKRKLLFEIMKVRAKPTPEPSPAPPPQLHQPEI
jgi:hypothetical protein